MTAEASSSSPGSGTYPRIRPPLPSTLTPPHGTPALPADATRWEGVPACAIAGAITAEALDVTDRARAARLRVSFEQRQLDRWLAARGLSRRTGA
jgi:hypothetical protein